LTFNNKETYKKLLNGEKILDKDGKDISWKLSSYWYKSFDEMAKKTVLRQLLSKWGIMSVEMTEAYVKDQAEVQADSSYDYIDAKTEYVKVEEKKEEQMATIKVDANGEVKEEAKEKEAEVDPFDFTI